MNGDDMLRALEAKRAEIDTALSELRHVLVVLSGPTLPETPKPAVTRQEKPRSSHKRPSGPTVPDGTAALIVAYVASQPQPVSAGDIIVGVKGARSEHIHLLRKQGRITATGSTSAMRYSVAKKAGAKPPGTAPAEVVWDGNHGGSLSSYQQKARG